MRVVIAHGGLNDAYGLWPQILGQQTQGGGADDIRQRRVLHSLRQQWLSIGPCVPAGVNGLAVVPSTSPMGSIPLRQCIGCPLWSATDVAVGAGIGCTDLHRQVRPWHAKAVVAPTIDHHIEAFAHVTGNTLGTCRVRLVEVMLRPVIGCGQVTLRTEGIALCP